MWIKRYPWSVLSEVDCFKPAVKLGANMTDFNCTNVAPLKQQEPVMKSSIKDTSQDEPVSSAVKAITRTPTNMSRAIKAFTAVSLVSLVACSVMIAFQLKKKRQNPTNVAESTQTASTSSSALAAELEKPVEQKLLEQINKRMARWSYSL